MCFLILSYIIFAVSVNQREAHDLAQQRSTVMFQAFCGLKYAMYALCIQANKRAQCRNSNANQTDGSLVDAEFLKEPGRENCFSQGILLYVLDSFLTCLSLF